MRKGGMRTLLTATAALAAALLAAPALSKDKDAKDQPAAASPVIATVNGEGVTKAEFDAVMKGNQRFFDLTTQATRDRLHGKPLSDYLFREEFLKIRTVAQANVEALPRMKEEIERIHQQLAGGADFAAVASEVSQDESSATKGGDLGEPKGFFDLVHPFNRIALSMKEGQISEPVLTMFGYHLIKIDKIYPPMEMKPKRVAVRHILIKFPNAGGDFRQQVEQLADAAKVEVTDRTYCKKLPTWCGEGQGL